MNALIFFPLWLDFSGEILIPNNSLNVRPSFCTTRVPLFFTRFQPNLEELFGSFLRTFQAIFNREYLIFFLIPKRNLFPMPIKRKVIPKVNTMVSNLIPDIQKDLMSFSKIDGLFHLIKTSKLTSITYGVIDCHRFS